MGDDVRFRCWELRSDERKLLVDGHLVAIGSRAFAVLCVLAEHRGRVVTKEQLLATAWAGRVVEENNISVQISTLRRLLGEDCIVTIPGVGYQLRSQNRPPQPHGALPAPLPGLPPAATPLDVEPRAPEAPGTTLFGRDADTRLLLEKLREVPIVNVTGTGGVGKTTLARAVLSRDGGLACGEVFWVDLTSVASGDELVAAVAKALGVLVDPADAFADLLSSLARTSGLVALDNCEHLIEPVRHLVREARKVARGMRWFVTSQVPLHLAGEYVHQLAPLEVPRPGVPLNQAVRTGALALLCDRATAAYRRFEITQDNLALAIDLCSRLDGLPLAIEMAASRVAMLGLRDVRDQLDGRLLLSSSLSDVPRRQSTLLQTLKWSHGLLSEVEQRVFRRLEPFVGGFTPAMARRMVTDLSDTGDGVAAWEAVEALSALVERSFVHRRTDLEGRYFLLESAREYACAMLVESGELAQVRRRHAEVMAERFAGARADLDDMRDADWAAIYLPERHNVRSALNFAIELGEPDLVARLVAALSQIDTFSRTQAQTTRCAISLDTLLEAGTAVRAAACVEYSWAQFLDGDSEIATRLAMQAVQDFLCLRDDAGLYQALSQLARICESRPDMMDEARRADRALDELAASRIPLRCRLFRSIIAGLQYVDERTVARLSELRDIAERAGFEGLAAVCRVHVLDQYLIDGDFEAAAKVAQRFLADGEPRPRASAAIRINLVLAWVQLGRADDALVPAHVVLRTLPSAAWLIAAAFALAAVRERRFEDAAILVGYCDRVRIERGRRFDPAEACAHGEVEAGCAGALPEARRRQLAVWGRSMSVEEMWSFILRGRASTAGIPADAGDPTA